MTENRTCDVHGKRSRKKGDEAAQGVEKSFIMVGNLRHVGPHRFAPDAQLSGKQAAKTPTDEVRQATTQTCAHQAVFPVAKFRVVVASV